MILAWVIAGALPARRAADLRDDRRTAGRAAEREPVGRAGDRAQHRRDRRRADRLRDRARLRHDQLDRAAGRRRVARSSSWALKLTPGTANQVPITAMLVLVDRRVVARLRVRARHRDDHRRDHRRHREHHDRARRCCSRRPTRRCNGSATRSRPRSTGSPTRSAARRRRPQLDELLLEARLLRPMETKADAALTQARESLTLNPRQTKHRRVLGRTTTSCSRRLGPVDHAKRSGMTRAFHDHYDDSLAGEPTLEAIAEELAGRPTTCACSRATRTSTGLRRDRRTVQAPPEHPACSPAPLVESATHPRPAALGADRLAGRGPPTAIHDEITGDRLGCAGTLRRTVEDRGPHRSVRAALTSDTSRRVGPRQRCRAYMQARTITPGRERPAARA